MPVFDFECQDCHKVFSELVFGKEKIICPFCASTKIKKQFSAFYTVSQSTRFETNAKDLPSMAQWAKAKKQGVILKNKKAALAPISSIKKNSLKPRPGVHRRKPD